MAKAGKVEPLQAVVDDTTGTVSNVIVCDQATADDLAELDVFTGTTLHDVTGRNVGVGWSWDNGEWTPPPVPPPVEAPPTPTAPQFNPVTREEFDMLMTMVLEG